jgi:hypothetical protein
LLLLLSVARTLVPAVLTKSYALPAPILAILDRSYGTTLALSLIGAAVLIIPAAVFWILEKRRSLATSAASFLTVAAVLFPIQAGYSLVEWRSTATDSGFQQQGMLVPVKPERQPLRLVWIVFDELDYELAFPLRPPDVQTPQLDRFRSESVFATQAHPTAHLTSMAFPSFFTGRVVTNFNPHSAANVELRFQDGKAAIGRRLQSCLPTADIGNQYRVGRLAQPVLPLHHRSPQPMHLGIESLASKPCPLGIRKRACWTSAPRCAFSRRRFRLLSPGPDPVRQYIIFREKQIEQFKSTLDEGLKLSVDPKLGVVLIHSLVPHPPGFWDRHQNKFSTSPSANYFDNLEAMDLALGKIRGN